MTKPIEKDPNGFDAGTPGAKLDSGKSPVMQGMAHYFPRACRAIANLSQKGAEKYAWNGWEKVPDGINRYGNAMLRHVLDEPIVGEIDPDTGELQATCTAWNSMARLELILRSKESQ